MYKCYYSSPAAGIHRDHRDVYIIPPPRAGGGAVGTSTPVSTAPLGLFHSVDPLLATQLHEDPASLAVRDTRLRVLSTIHLVQTGLVGQLTALRALEYCLPYAWCEQALLANSRPCSSGKRRCSPQGDSNIYMCHYLKELLTQSTHHHNGIYHCVITYRNF